MTRWSESEARNWLSEIGPWAESALGEKFAELHIGKVRVFFLLAAGNVEKHFRRLINFG